MKKTNRQGFSMIEVLVASTILIMIVMMLGSLFQQTSTAWRVGLMRTGGYGQLRSYVGTIQRDASAMVNANLLPKILLKENKDQSFESGKISFYTITGSDNARSLNYITHNTSGKRTQRTLKLGGQTAGSDPKWEDEETTEILQFLPGQDNPVAPQGFDFKWPVETEYDRDGNAVSGDKRFPLYLTIGTKISPQGHLYDVGAESAGPDKKWDTKDDIRTFIK
jgi:type II secretory pathway pseudopilin PulG